MPADYIIRSIDMLRVTIFPPAIVPQLVAPLPLVGTSTNMIVFHMPVCLEGDELPPMVRGLPLTYQAPPFVTPGAGMLEVQLTPLNKTLQTKNGGKAILIKGGQFPARLMVVAPAMQPTPAGPIPDPVLTKPGIAEFITSNYFVKAW